MTISSTTNRVNYTGNGVTTAFAFPYKFLANADLKVYQEGTLKTITTHYTVTGAGDDAGGTVTFLVAPANLDDVVIIRDPAILQGLDLVENDNLPAESLENSFDLITMVAQRLDDRISRALVLNDADVSSPDLTIPSPVADEIIGWNSAGDALESKAVALLGAVSIPVSIAQGGTGSATSADARSALGLAIGTDVQAYDVDIATVAASQAEMEAGSETALRSMSPLRVSQAIAALAGGGGVQIQPVSATVGSNALTISASSLSLDFRSTTLGSGAVTAVSGTPSNLVISSGSTLGTINATQSRIVVLAINNAGTIELAAVNISGGNDLSETGLISTTAEGGAGAADSASTIYSTTARSNVAYRVIGYIESTQATAGTWATAPSTIQGAGGQAVTAMSSLGYGQTWQDVTGSRATATTYYNTTGKPIQVVVSMLGASIGSYSQFNINGTLMTYTGQAYAASSGVAPMSLVVPPGSNYSVTNTSGANTVNKWVELR